MILDKKHILFNNLLNNTNIISKETFYNNINNNWNIDTLYYLKHSKLRIEKYKEYKDADLERFLYGKTMNQYLNTLIRGWMSEDFVFEILKINYNVKLANKDAEREFLFNNPFSLQELDLKIVPEIFWEDDINIDVMSDFTGYFKKKGSVSLNFEKYNKFKENDYLIVLDILNSKMAILHPKTLKAEKMYGKQMKNQYKYEMYFDYDKSFHDIDKFKEKSFIRNFLWR